MEDGGDNAWCTSHSSMDFSISITQVVEPKCHITTRIGYVGLRPSSLFLIEFRFPWLHAYLTNAR